MRIYLQSIVAGVIAAAVAAITWTAAMLLLPVAGAGLLSKLEGSGAGGAGAVVDSGSIAVVAGVGFAIGVWWQIRRSRRSRTDRGR